jgi:ergothioneine biosynthesis protein EgtB
VTPSTRTAPRAASTSLADRFAETRRETERVAAPLSPEDCAAQSMPDASPIGWHLAHTSWFFETFVIGKAEPRRPPFDPGFGYLFNSYYNAIGERVPRPMRGRITRPGLEEILAYRRHVDAAVLEVIRDAGDPEIARLLELGLNHEQQHQELMRTDVKHLLSLHPALPAYANVPRAPRVEAAPLRFVRCEGGLHETGHSGDGFAFDNEGPRHRVFTPSFELASRPATNGEYLRFVEAGGYADPSLWLSDGWDWIAAESIRAPLYWMRGARGFETFTLGGVRELDPSEPVVHVSYYEADAFARWSSARLPREDEWELGAEALPVEGNFAESGALHPRATPVSSGLSAMFGDVWEWTSSPYVGYPGYAPAPGALGEYNGKFMCNRLVLRGGSCASPRSHLRATYRNFFVPTTRWQFSGIRLARDAR